MMSTFCPKKVQVASIVAPGAAWSRTARAQSLISARCDHPASARATIAALEMTLPTIEEMTLRRTSPTRIDPMETPRAAFCTKPESMAARRMFMGEH